jgi:hypothetical protein
MCDCVPCSAAVDMSKVPEDCLATLQWLVGLNTMPVARTMTLLTRRSFVSTLQAPIKSYGWLGAQCRRQSASRVCAGARRGWTPRAIRCGLG